MEILMATSNGGGIILPDPLQDDNVRSWLKSVALPMVEIWLTCLQTYKPQGCQEKLGGLGHKMKVGPFV